MLEFIGSGKKVMYNVLDISKYIINKSIEINKPVDNLKLQKLLYYVQAIFLTNSNEPCFVQDIVHWRHGPVVVEAYKNTDAWDMVAKTLKEDPWLNTERNEIISNYNIKKYFLKNKNRILSKYKRRK